MAAASPLKSIEDNFCLCSICLEQLKDPKLMPCLHRYCKDCLGSVLQRSHAVFRCPECTEEIQIPENGVEGFKTDFYSKSLVEYVQIQQSLKSDEVRECYSCSKHLRVAAYCFKCNDFLCEDCYTFHVTNKTLKDHQKHTLCLEDIESRNITIERLASMRDAPRCRSHPERISELYCETCSRTPVCLVCAHGEHKGHDLHDVKALAKSKREELSQKLKNLKKVKEDKMISNLTHLQEKLSSNVSTEKENLTKIHQGKVQEIMKKIQETERKQQQVKTEKQNTEKQIFDSLQKEMETEIERIKKKYEEIFRLKRSEVSADFGARESSLAKELSKWNVKLQHFNRDKKELLESIEKQFTENDKIIKTISEHFDNTEKRFETLNVMASSILASENDWTVVQCIPDMCTAAANLLEDLNHGFPELTALTEVTVNYKQSSFGKTGISKISEQVEMELQIDNIHRYFNSITSSGDGNIVISGYPHNGKEAFIIVIDVNGKLIKQRKVNVDVYGPYHFCDILPHNKVVSVCEPSKIVLHDMQHGSCIEKNINEVTNNWPKLRRVRCVATVNKQILVGGKRSRDLYVFDDQLNYLHILTLPEMIKWPRDITVSNGHLLVCDYDGKNAYVTTMEGLESKVVSEFMKPDLVGSDWRPWSVCTDTNGLVYMLWRNDWSGSQRYLVQYTHDGRQVLETRKMDDNACAVAVIETSQGEKLVVVTHTTQRVYLIDLIDEE